eukprot:gene25164-32829_t
MAFAFDFIAPLVVNDVAYFIFSVGLSLLVSSKRSKRTTMSLRLPSEREVPASFNSSTNSTSEKSFHTNVKAALDSCGPYNAAIYRGIDYHGFLHTTVPFVVRNLSRVFFYSLNIFNFGGSLVYNRQTVELADGSIIAIDWACLRGVSTEEIIGEDIETCSILICHGLCGDSQAEYIIHLVETLLRHSSIIGSKRRRYRVGVLIFRGCGGLPLRGCEAFAGHTKSDDIHAALVEVKTKYPGDKIFLMGFSLGGAFTLKYLAKCEPLDSSTISLSSPVEDTAVTSSGSTEAGYRNSMVTAAMCVSPPWDFRKRTAVFDLLWNMLLTIPLKQFIFSHFFSFFFFPSFYSEPDAFISPSASEKYQRRASNLRKVGPWRILAAGSLTAIDGLLYQFYEE